MKPGQKKFKPEKLPVLPWIEEYINIPKKGSKKIDLSKCHLFSSQFDELHQEFSIENRRHKVGFLRGKKLSSINSDETLKMRHDNYLRNTISHPSVNQVYEKMFDNEIIPQKKQLPKLNHSIKSSKLPDKINNQNKIIPQIDFMKNKGLISRIRREKENRYRRQLVKYI